MKHSKKIVKDAALGEEPKVDSLRERVYQYLNGIFHHSVVHTVYDGVQLHVKVYTDHGSNVAGGNHANHAGLYRSTYPDGGR